MNILSIKEKAAKIIVIVNVGFVSAFSLQAFRSLLHLTKKKMVAVFS